MCRCLCLHPSGFYAWVKNPLSHRAHEDLRQIELLKVAWKDSGKIYSERLTGALLDRLTHHVHILEMNGESYRLKHSRNNRQ
jgi:DNA replication protein DnaC